MIPAPLTKHLYTLFPLSLSGFEHMYTNMYVTSIILEYVYVHTRFYVLLYPLNFRFFTLLHCIQIYHLK